MSSLNQKLIEFTQIKNSLTNLKEKVVKYLELLEDK